MTLLSPLAIDYQFQFSSITSRHVDYFHEDSFLSIVFDDIIADADRAELTLFSLAMFWPDEIFRHCCFGYARYFTPDAS
jgi:hypothetical protein